MPLSEHEKRLLDEIEQTLRGEDPDLAASLRLARPQPKLRTLIPLAILSLLVGLALLFIGLELADGLGIGLAVVGFVLLVGCGEATARLVGTIQRARRGQRRPPDEAPAT